MTQAFAPGRTELAGNHVDHQGGMVIAATIADGIHVESVASAADAIEIESAGFGNMTLDLAELRACPGPRSGEERSSIALVRGMAAQLISAGYEPRGFKAQVASYLAPGNGLSSSAAFELALGALMRAEFSGPEHAPLSTPVGLAQAAQVTEQRYFGKPCGLMDQLAIACGGINVIDFRDPDAPRVERLDFSFEEHGYSVVLVDSGVRHDDAGATADYASIPTDMTAVANALGAERLVEVDIKDFFAAKERLQSELGELPVARATHFFLEQRLTQQRVEAMRAGDMESYLVATAASGRSSHEQLRNSGGAWKTIEAARRIMPLGSACRIHGGGFGGCVQVYVPTELVADFTRSIEAELGQGCCMVLKFTEEGAWAR